MISSPAPMPSAAYVRWSAAVPLAQTTACGAPSQPASAASKRATRGPQVSRGARSASTTAATSSWLTLLSARPRVSADLSRTAALLANLAQRRGQRVVPHALAALELDEQWAIGITQGDRCIDVCEDRVARGEDRLERGEQRLDLELADRRRRGVEQADD